MLDGDELNDKIESGVAGDDPLSALVDALFSVGESRGDGDLALLPDLHALDTDVPALDHVSGAELEVELVRGVELLAALLQRAFVGHHDGLSLLGCRGSSGRRLDPLVSHSTGQPHQLVALGWGLGGGPGISR